MQEETVKKIIKKRSGGTMGYVIGLLALALIAFGGYFGWTKYQDSKMMSGNLQTGEQTAEQAGTPAPTKEELAAIEKNKIMYGKLSKITILPQEEPVVLEVKDAELLQKQQAFFKDVQNGDALFVFPKSLKAIIFRDSTNLIVNSGPLQTDPQGGKQGQQQTQGQNQQPAQQQTAPAKVSETIKIKK